MPSKSRHGRKNKGSVISSASTTAPGTPAGATVPLESSSSHTTAGSSTTDWPAPRQLATPLPEPEIEQARYHRRASGREHTGVEDGMEYHARGGAPGTIKHGAEGAEGEVPQIAAGRHDSNAEDDSGLPELGTFPALIDFDFEESASAVSYEYTPFEEDPVDLPPGAGPEPYPEHAFYGDVVYRSPPFREAQLPVEEGLETSPSPLPVRPRVLEDDEYEEGDAFAGFAMFREFEGQGDERDLVRVGAEGHTRSPTIPIRTLSTSSRNQPISPTVLSSIAKLSRSPPMSAPALRSRPSTTSPPTSATFAAAHTKSPPASAGLGSSTFENLSKTIRTYGPFPSAAPPLVSTPVSFGRFSGATGSSSGAGAGAYDYEREYELGGEDKAPGTVRQRFKEPRLVWDGRTGEDESTVLQNTGRSKETGAISATNPVPERQRAWKETGTVAGKLGDAPPSSAPLPQRKTGAHRSADGGSEGGGDGVSRVGRARNETMKPTSFSELGRTLRNTSSRGNSSHPRSEDGDVKGGRTKYPAPGSGEVDSVVWAKWDRCPTAEGGGKTRLYLVLGYARGLQIWDTTSLGSVKEILNINFDGAIVEDLGLGDIVDKRGSELTVVDAAIVPPPAGAHRFWDAMPLLGILLASALREGSNSTVLALYSLRTHVVVNKVNLAGVAQRFECNERYFAVSTSLPSTIHVLDSIDLSIIHSVPASSLASFAHPPQGHRSTTYLPTSSSSDLTNSVVTAIQPGSLNSNHAHPIFSLSHRLLAYASPSPSSSPNFQSFDRKGRRNSSSSSNGSGPSPSSYSSASPFSLAGLSSLGNNISSLGNISELSKQVQSRVPTTQAELGSAALKVGGSVLSGMRFLGGKAVAAAMGTGGRESGSTSQRVSKSAPTNDTLGSGMKSDERSRRRFSNMTVLSPIEGSAEFTTQRTVFQDRELAQKTMPVPPFTKARPERGFTIRVVDLSMKPELSLSRPRVVADFIGSRSQPISKIQFSADGCSLLVVPKDGQVTKVFRLAPTPPSHYNPPGSLAVDNSRPDKDATEEPVQAAGTATHLYDLRRGISGAVVDDVEVLSTGLLTGVTTRNRTVHVFGLNPYGGRPDVRSHVSGRVKNLSVLPPSTKVQLSPIARIRGSRLSVGNESNRDSFAPLAFTFIHPGDTVALPPSLSSITRSPNLASPSSDPPPSNSPLLGSPASRHTVASRVHYQDALLFDSVEGTLYLQRISVDYRAVREGSNLGAMSSLGSVSTTVASGFASISVSGLGGAGPLSRSVSSSVSDRSNTNPLLAGGGSGVVGRGEEGSELVASVSVVATWNLQKGVGWDEIKTPIGVEDRGKAREQKKTRQDSLAQAELSSFSCSRYILPRPIYLSHQFSFHDIGEDYHALIRRYNFAIPTTKIDVRKDILVHAFGVSIPHIAPGNSNSELFLEGFLTSPTSPRSIRQAPSSSYAFDEPLASAISGEMDFGRSAGGGETVLPMYPNGVPGSRGGKSLMSQLPQITSSIPIKLVGDGVSEGFGRIRRGIQWRNESKGTSAVDSGREMAFEFDVEENDEFMAPMIRATSGVPSASSAGPKPVNDSLHSLDDDVVGHVDEEIWGEGGWDTQDRAAVEDEEQFQTISKTTTIAPQHRRPGGTSVKGPILTSTGDSKAVPDIPIIATPSPSSKSRLRKKSDGFKKRK